MKGMGTEVLVLGGGPDAEREVSLWSSKAVADALASLGRYRVRYVVIGKLTAPELRSLPGEVVFPVLHGGWGEGGPLQELLEADGRPGPMTFMQLNRTAGVAEPRLRKTS